MRQPVVFGGPFVMNTKVEIAKAFADYHTRHRVSSRPNRVGDRVSLVAVSGGKSDIPALQQ
ncbi:pirin-like C-terminal cupin domain-containing protein, partial [Nocardia sp. SC052]